MLQYPEIRDTLAGTFSISVGLSWGAAKQSLEHALSSDEWRKKFENELTEAFSCSSTPWVELLCNDKYEVDDPQTEEDAREIAAKLLWNTTFPDRPLPEITK